MLGDLTVGCGGLWSNGRRKRFVGHGSFGRLVLRWFSHSPDAVRELDQPCSVTTVEYDLQLAPSRDPEQKFLVQHVSGDKLPIRRDEARAQVAVVNAVSGD
jgi:hypothetical protein